VKVLLDECVDWRLARDIIGHDVRTARHMGWTGFKNGELLTLAAAQFDVFDRRTKPEAGSGRRLYQVKRTPTLTAWLSVPPPTPPS
jgi:hypothetical protein